MRLHVLLWSLRSAALTRLLRRHPLPGEGDPFHHHQSSALMLGSPAQRQCSHARQPSAKAVLSCSTEVSSSREEVVPSAARDRWRAALRTDHKINKTNTVGKCRFAAPLRLCTRPADAASHGFAYLLNYTVQIGHDLDSREP